MARRVLIGRSQWRTGTRETELGWMDGVKVSLGNIGIAVEAERQCAKDRKSGEPWYICN